MRIVDSILEADGHFATAEGTPILARLGPAAAGQSPSFFVLVSAPQPGAIAVFEHPSEYTFRREALVWRDWVVVAFGERVELVRLATASVPAAHVTIGLDGYFSDLHALPACLLVASAVSVRCVDSTGALRWRTEPLAVDGVRFEDVGDDRVRLSAECDPPGGWRKVELELSTGARV